MKKINGGYTSLFERLMAVEQGAHSFDKYKILPWIYRKFYKEKSYSPFYGRRFNETPKHEAVDQLLGSLQPFAEMANDFQYTFKRYRTWTDVGMDFLQPLRGLLNIVKGLTIWVGTLVYGVGAIISDLFRLRFKEVIKDVFFSLSWLIEGSARIIRGLSQIVATPLTWLVKIPLRAIKTLIQGRPDILENEHIKRLVKLAEEMEPSTNKEEATTESALLIQQTLCKIADKITKEFSKQKARGQKDKRNVEMPPLTLMGTNPMNHIRWFKLVEKPSDATSEQKSSGCCM